MNPKIKHHFGDNPIIWVPAWGISKLRKRAGKFAGAVIGETRWYDAWYNRVMSREMAFRLADLGVNLVILPFSLGGSAEAEREEHDDFERMTRWLHEAGIVSLPYLQYQNILQETHLLPDAVWAQGLDDSRTQFAHWRRTVCQGSPGFIAYMNGLTDAAVRRGADGIWIDNTYKKLCGCSLCMEKFRAFLAERYAHLLDELRLPNFDRVELPRANTLAPYRYDPIVQAYMDFLCSLNLSIHRELKAHLESLSPNGLYATNPGIYRGKYYAEAGMDFYEFLKLHDIIYLENKLFPRMDGTKAVGNYHGFIGCRAAHTIGIPGAWKPAVDFDSTIDDSTQGLPKRADEIEAILFEAAVFNGVLGLYWAIRSRMHGDSANREELLQTRFERPDFHAPTKKALDYLKSLPQGERTNVADVAVFYGRASHALNYHQTEAAILCAEEMLHQARIPYSVLFSQELDTIDRFAVVVCPDIHLLSDADAEALRRYVASGGRLMVIGHLGAEDERRRVREELPLHDVTGASAFRIEEIVRRDFGNGRATTFTRLGVTKQPIANVFPNANLFVPVWAEHYDRIVTEIDTLLPRGRQVRVEGEGALGVSLSKLPDGRTFVQVLRYGVDLPSQRLTVHLREDLAGGDRAQSYAAYRAPVEVAAQRDSNGYRSFVIEGFHNYAALLVV